MRSQTAVRLGVQTPRVQCRPNGIVSSAGPEATDLAAACGLILDPWQSDLLDVSLGERADGSWAASDVKVIASRQNGKNGAVEARELFGAVILGEQIIHTAHLFTTTRESYNRLVGLVEGHPDIAERVTLKYASPASGYEIRFRGGGRVKFIARSRTSGRGLTGNVLVFDEDQDLDDDAQGALLPTTSAVGDDRQVWYLGSAPGPLSQVAHRLRRRGRSGGDDRFAYAEFSADPCAELDDREAWAQANPALGTRITEEAVEAERRSMSAEMFARERLSISPDVDPADTPKVWAPGVWESVVAEVPKPEHGLVFSVAVNVERSAAVIGWASAGGTCGLVVDKQGVARRAGVGWVVGELSRFAGDARVAVSSQDGSLLLALEQAGLKVHPVSAAEQRAGCVWMYDAVVERKVVVQRHPDLAGAVASAVKKPSGDGFVWDRRAGDVSALVAVTDAAYLAQGKPAAGPPLMAFVVKGKR